MEENASNIPGGASEVAFRQSKSNKKSSSLNVHINPKIISAAEVSNLNQLTSSKINQANVYINPGFLNGSTTAAPLAKPESLYHNITSNQDTVVQAHINPNFINRNSNVSAMDISFAQETKSNVHINPNFVGRSLPLPPSSSVSSLRLPNSIETESSSKKSYVEECGKRSRPHINPKFVDALKTKAYDDAIKKTVNERKYMDKNVNAGSPCTDGKSTEEFVSTNIYINPNFNKEINSSHASFIKDDSSTEEIEVARKPTQAPNIGKEIISAKSIAFKYNDGKENHGSLYKKDKKADIPCKANILEKSTPNLAKSAGRVNNSLNKKTLFKKIGTRKLVRMSGASPPSTSGKHQNKVVGSSGSSQIGRNSQCLDTPVSRVAVQSKVCDTSSGSAFKKIGYRKLIRKTSSSSKPSSSSAKLKAIPLSIGHKKVSSAQIYRVKTSNRIIKESETPVTSIKANKSLDKFANKRFLFTTPMGKKSKQQKPTSTGRKKSLCASPIQTARSVSLATSFFNKKRKTPFSIVRNPFRIDRRKCNLKRRLSMTSINNQVVNANQALTPGTKKRRFKVNNKSLNKQITAINLPSQKPKVTPAVDDSYNLKSIINKSAIPPPKPVRKPNSQNVSRPKTDGKVPSNNESQQATLIQVHGVRYSVSENGRKLKRLPPKGTNIETNVPNDRYNSANSTGNSIHTSPRDQTQENKDKKFNMTESITKKKFYLEGEEYVEDEPGILVRSRNSMTRASITNYKSRSIHTIIKSQTRAKQYCMFYNKFGKCNKKDKGVCPYIHDSEKVAVCRKFLHGNCFKETCLLSHKVAPEKMPSCKFFLEGLCTKGETCPYRHVKVSDAAEMCKDYQMGYCPNGLECKKKHEYASQLNHSKTKQIATDSQPTNVGCRKKIPPAKPKRKSLGPVSEQKKVLVDPSNSARRYYEQDKVTNKADLDVNQTNSNGPQINNADHIDAQYDSIHTSLLQTDESAKKSRTPVKETTLEGTNNSPTSQNQNLLQSPNDSGPYEEIDDDTTELAANSNCSHKELETQAFQRPPLGKLPSYISLNNFSEDLVDQETGDQIDTKISDAKQPDIENTGAAIILSPEVEYEERLI